MSKRAQNAARTRDNIISATEKLLAEKSLEEISLNAIASQAGVTVQTVLRHMDSRDGCLQAVAEKVHIRVKKQRAINENENISDAIENLIAHYEKEGKLVLNILAQEQSTDSFASELTTIGRNYHRKWVEKCFKPYLDNRKPEVIDCLIVATDIYTWKLLRKDLGRTRSQTKKAVLKMVNNLTEAS
jgi:AcrR family transcriptional regulator